MGRGCEAASGLLLQPRRNPGTRVGLLGLRHGWRYHRANTLSHPEMSQRLPFSPAQPLSRLSMTRPLAFAMVFFSLAAPRGSAAENPGPYGRQVAERAELYRRQLDLYSRAAEAILKCETIARWLYFLAPATEFQIK